jgi:SRSO17 transposase
MSLRDIASLGKMLAQFLALFVDCFHGVKGQRLFAAYVRGLLSELGRRNVEAIALKQGVAPRTLQRFLESIKWDHDEVLRRCHRLVVTEQSDPQAIGVIDETGTAKAGRETVGVKRQYNGNRGKVENAVVSVALSFATKAFQCLIAARMYLPEEWVNDLARRKKLMSLTTSNF